MNKSRLPVLLALPAIVAVLLATPSVASAKPVSNGPAFGQHVSQCAHAMGFSAEHNPGMHQGRSGWDGLPC